MPSRQLVILNAPTPDAKADAAPQVLGDRRDVLRTLADYNTQPDSPDGEFLYGPGFTVQLPPGRDEVVQLLVIVVEEDMAFPVLIRLCKAVGWTMLDPDSGRTLAHG